MEVCIGCSQNVSAAFINKGICISCETKKEVSLQQLQARIEELERELQRQKTEVEKSRTFLQVMWGDNFNSDSLH